MTLEPSIMTETTVKHYEDHLAGGIRNLFYFACGMSGSDCLPVALRKCKRNELGNLEPDFVYKENFSKAKRCPG